MYRLTRAEARAMLRACQSERERWAIHLGLLTGARRAELLGFQGRHFRRPDLVHFSPDIAKGGRERWVPVLPELQSIVQEIQRLEDDDYVLCAQRWRDPGINHEKEDKRKFPASVQALGRLVREVGERAGIRHPMRPHLLRHAFADYVAEASGDVRIAQTLLGHAELGTTADVPWATFDRAASARGPGPSAPAIRRFDPCKPSRGADRNRTGVNGFAGRCVTTPPRRRSGPSVAS